MSNKTEIAYVLRVPLDKEQWVNLVSNKPMTKESFERLGRYLSLQEEMTADTDLASIEENPDPERTALDDMDEDDLNDWFERGRD